MKEKSKQLAPIDHFKSSLELMTDSFTSVLPRNIDVVKFKAVILTAVTLNPRLLECDRKSLFLACQKAAQDGLLPDGREAAIAPYKGAAQYMPMIGGIVKKIHEIVGAKIVSNQIICENDRYVYEEGLDPKLQHWPAFSNRGKELAVYAVAQYDNGQKVHEMVPWDDVEKVKATSKTTRDDAPWKIWPFEMAKKTAVRRLSKKLPMTAELDRILRRGDEDEESLQSSENSLPKQHAPKLTRLEAVAANNAPIEARIEARAEEIEAPAEILEDDAEAVAQSIEFYIRPKSNLGVIDWADFCRRYKAKAKEAKSIDELQELIHINEEQLRRLEQDNAKYHKVLLNDVKSIELDLIEKEQGNLV